MAGRPVRPGLSATGALLLPLQKTRGGEETPAFPAEVIYFERGDAWPREGHATLALPSLDLPVSRTGVVVYHSPEFRLSFDRGAFRVAEFEAPLSPALGPEIPASPPPAPAANGPAARAKKDAREEDFQGLVDQFRQGTRSGRMSAALPVQVSLPEVGSTVFLISELTAEGATPSIAFAYQKGGKK